MLSTIKSLVKEAGKIALEKQVDITSLEKADKSPVTAVDIELSGLIREGISVFTNLPNHMFIDEEFEENSEKQWNDFNAAEYAWFVDPIAGTWAYLNGLPVFAISIGVLKNRKPYIGAVFLPALDELYWCDGKTAYMQKGVNEPKALVVNDKPMNKFSLFYINVHQRFTISEKICRTVSFPAINPGLLWSARGSLCGSLMKLKVWDFAGAWSVCKAAGLDMYRYEDGSKLDEITQADFDGEWKMKAPMILANAENIETLRKNIKTL